MLNEATTADAVGPLLERGVMRPVACRWCGHSERDHDRQYGCGADGCDCERFSAQPRTVAALYVEPKGCYVGVPGVLESLHATQDTRSQKGVPRRISSRKARESKEDNSGMAGRKPGARISKRKSVARQERRQTARIQGCIPRKEQGRHSRRSTSVERKSWVQRGQERAGRERAAATSPLRIDARVLRADVGRARRRVCHLSEQRSRHEARQSALCGSLSHNKPRPGASLPSMQHHAWCGQRLFGNIASWGRLS